MRTTALAAAVRARYARRPAFVPAPAMSLAARRVPVTLRSLHRHDQYLLWDPRLSFVLAESRNRAMARREQLEMVKQRIVSRVERVEGPPTSPSQLPGTVPSAPRARLRPKSLAGPSLERVFQAPRATGSPPVSSGSPAPAVASSAREMTRWPGWPPARTAAAPLAPMDVERLTDQVVHSIGRRMSAYRERLGR